MSDGLPEITDKQKEYAFEKCFVHYAFRKKSGLLTCMECGHSWQGESTLIDTVCGATCPNCGKPLVVELTRKRKSEETECYCIMTTSHGLQVLRYFAVHRYIELGKTARYWINEIVQWWIDPSGKYEIVSRPLATYQYVTNFCEYKEMAIRANKDNYLYRFCEVTTYPKRCIIPEIKRNGYRGKFHGLDPAYLFVGILSNPKMETLLKAGQYDLLRTGDDRYWPEIKICIRNNYIVKNSSMWIDYIRLLQHFGKDTRNAKYICPENLKQEHDRYLNKKIKQDEQRELDEKRAEMLADESEFRALKSRFFGTSFTDGEIQVRVLESVREYIQEGEAMHHCVYQCKYHLKPESLVLSATMDGKRLETVELSLEDYKVVQSRGVCNENTPYHDRIIQLVESNAFMIKLKAI